MFFAMTHQFNFSVPIIGGNPLTFSLGGGEVLYLLGANGTGKSSLVSKLFTMHQANARRISAHRQTWFESNTPDITASARKLLESNFHEQDMQIHARHREWNPAARATMAIFDLIDADTVQERKIAALVRQGDDVGAKEEAKIPSPIQVINEMMRLSNLPIKISLQEGQSIFVQKNGGHKYSIAELSDGERNAFLIGAAVLTAKPGTLILIDEPERHLHRSIASPLLKFLFDKRKDCSFVVSTHELMLPIDMPAATTLLVRGCEYQGQVVKAWTLDMMPPGAPINEELKQDIFGARRKIIFVEGTLQSLDAPLYGLLFPQVSIIPKETCRSVEHAVRGLRGASDMHWIEAWGIVDNDQRSQEDIDRLRDVGVWALSHYSVESYYYHPNTIRRIAARNSKVTGEGAELLAKTAIDSGVAAAIGQKDHMITSAVLRSARETMKQMLPTRKNIQNKNSVNVEIDVAALRAVEEVRFDSLIASWDWDGLLARYPLRESPAFDRVVEGIKLVDRATYRAAVLKMLQEEPDALEELRALLGDLYSIVIACVRAWFNCHFWG